MIINCEIFEKICIIATMFEGIAERLQKEIEALPSDSMTTKKLLPQ